MRNVLKNFKPQAAWESARNVFAVLGVGSTLAYIGTMHVVIGILSTVLVSSTWYGMYRMYE